jgi:hypothetical protein
MTSSKVKKEKKDNATSERQKTAQFYYFVVGVELFSRYAFVALIDRNNQLVEEKPSPEEISEMPKVDGQAVQEQINLFNKAYRPTGKEVVDIFKKWFEMIAKDGYILCNVVSDNGNEFINQDVSEFLSSGADGIFNEVIEKYNKETKQDDDIKENFDSVEVPIPLPIQQVQTVPNDEVANPIAERFIQTFKRLWGQYTAKVKKANYNQEDVDKIVDFYNNRVHSSTGYSPNEILKKDMNKDLSMDEIQDTLFNLYTLQKTQMYLNPHFESSSSESPKIPIDSYVRIYTKWNTPDANIGEKKSNINNWSYTLFKVKKFDTYERSYELDMVGKDGKIIELKKFKNKTGYKEYANQIKNNLNKNDSKLVVPYSLRSNFLKVIDYDAFKEYNIT